METAAIRGPVRVDSTSPFICTFLMLLNDVEVVAALIGDLGRTLHGTLRTHDIVQVEGHFINGQVVDQHEVYAIENMILPQDAATGRNLNAWG